MEWYAHIHTHRMYAYIRILREHAYTLYYCIRFYYYYRWHGNDISTVHRVRARRARDRSRLELMCQIGWIYRPLGDAYCVSRKIWFHKTRKKTQHQQIEEYIKCLEWSQNGIQIFWFYLGILVDFEKKFELILSTVKN